MKLFEKLFAFQKLKEVKCHDVSVLKAYLHNHGFVLRQYERRGGGGTSLLTGTSMKSDRYSWVHPTYTVTYRDVIDQKNNMMGFANDWFAKWQRDENETVVFNINDCGTVHFNKKGRIDRKKNRAFKRHCKRSWKRFCRTIKGF